MSLIDLLPTLIELGGGDVASLLAAETDGRSLLPQLAGGTGHDEVIGEYLAEGAIAPIVMVRRNGQKFVHSPADPDQLYDLRADCDEKTNLAADPAHAGTVAALRAEVACRWDLPALDAAVTRQPPPPSAGRCGTDARRGARLGFSAVPRCEPELCSQHDRPRRAGGDGAVSSGATLMSHAKNPLPFQRITVIPAKAGIQVGCDVVSLDPRFRGDDREWSDPSRPCLSRASTSLFPLRKPWVAGTSPAMTT